MFLCRCKRLVPVAVKILGAFVVTFLLAYDGEFLSSIVGALS